jgi:hypothetical protein
MTSSHSQPRKPLFCGLYGTKPCLLRQSTTIAFRMMLARHNRIGSARPLFPVRRITATNIRHISHDERATILSRHPELRDQAARKRILGQYIDRYANLGLNQNTELQKVRLLGDRLAQFVRLRSEAVAARLLEDEPSGKLFRQYRECAKWLKNNTPRVKAAYEAEKKAVLKQFSNLALEIMRENVLKQYEMEYKRITVPTSHQEEEKADQPREVIAGVTHEERQRFFGLELQYVVIHLLENPITSKDALEE